MRESSQNRKHVTFALTVVAFLFVSATSGWADAPGTAKFNHFKALLQSGKTAIGTHVSLAHPDATEIIANAGFDWLFIDLEHKPIDPENMHALIKAMKGTKAAPVVRVPGKRQWLTKTALDIGAMGILMPGIETRDEAAELVRSVRYPPAGVRGIGPRYAAKQWGISVADYLKVADGEILAIVLIEHAGAVQRIDEILSVSGIDLVFVGPNDLAASMGLIGQPKHPRVEAAVETVLEAARKKGLPAGTVVTNVEDANKRIEQGFQAIMVSHDTSFLEAGSKDVLNSIKR